MPASMQAQIEQLKWLQAHPDFAECPATILEFLGPDYLNIEAGVRETIKKVLVDIFGEKVAGDRIAMFNEAVITGGIGIGKGHTPETPMLTPTGWVRLGSIKVGDQVIGSNGHCTYVTGVFPRGRLQSYKVTMTDGSSVIVDGDHLWNVKSPKQKMRNSPWSTVSTLDLIAAGITQENGSRKWHIPVVEPVEFDYADDPAIAPYLLGALIGDGSFVDASPKISSIDNEILSRVHAESGLELTYISGCDYRLTSQIGAGGVVTNWLTNSLREFGLHGKRSHEKFIPRQYFTASVRTRQDLLRGLMDTDGYILSHGSVQISTSSPQLATDIVELVRSLGGIAKRTLKKTSYKDAHVLTLNLKFNPFWLKRKASQWQPFEKYEPSRMIASIEPAGIQEIICISVKAEDQLYVTNDFIVTHNTTFASIMLPYMVHWILCLNDPQAFLNLLPGSRIAFMMMSTSEAQAKEVLFGDVKARIQYSPWFTANYPYDPKYKNSFRFDKDIWILPGDSAETTFEGYNILGGIIDEADSHKVVKEKDYAEAGYDTIAARISSRFGNRGFLLVIGQMKKSQGFVARKFKEMTDNPNAFAVRMTIWESLGWDKYLNPDGTRNSFWYDTRRKTIVLSSIVDLVPDKSNLIEIPNLYIEQFKNNPEKALRDLAGIPPAINDPFISLVHKITDARDRWNERYDNLGSPVDTSCLRPQLAKWFVAKESMRRVVHVDLAYSSEGDALGLAMGHVESVVEIDDELKPYIVIDMLYRMRAAPGTEIMLADIRHLIYYMKDDLKFNIKKVTMDGFQSTDFLQQLQKRRYNTEMVSMDKTILPYHDLREAIYENRIDFPPYVTYLNPGDTKTVEITIQELEQLQDNGKKIDHPERGSKDVADAIAGVVYTLMGDRSYRRGVVSLDVAREERATGTDSQRGMGGSLHPAYNPGYGSHPAASGLDGLLQAPIPPSIDKWRNNK